MHKGSDAGKKVSGIKRHIAVDSQGLPQAIAVTTAQVTDRKGALATLECYKPGLSRVQSLLCDAGYVGQPFAQGVKDTLGEHVTVQIAKRSKLHTHLQGHAQALGGRAQLCLAGKEQAAVEELRAAAQHQCAIPPSGISGSDTQEIVDRL